MNQDQIVTKRRHALKKIADYKELLEQLQTVCKHPNADKKYCADTGNYDMSQDSYWIEWSCPDCGKKWDTPQ